MFGPERPASEVIFHKQNTYKLERYKQELMLFDEREVLRKHDFDGGNSKLGFIEAYGYKRCHTSDAVCASTIHVLNP